MKQIITFFCLLIASISGVVAQTFYVMSYSDPRGKNFKSLVLYNDDEENTEIRTVSLDHPSDIKVHNYISQYYGDDTEEDSDDEISYTIMTSGGDLSVYPSLVFYWDPDETEVRQRTPYMCFDEDWEFDQYLRANYFDEVSLIYMNETLIGQFYRQSDPMYKRLVNAHNVAVQQEAELVRTLHDGSELYRTMLRLYDKSTGNSTQQTAMKQFYETYYKAYGMKAEQDPNHYGQENKATTPLVRPDSQRRNPLLDDDDDKAAAPEAAIHLVVLANTEISDIGMAVNMDLRRINSEIKGVCSKLGLTFKPYLISGLDFSKETLQKKLDDLKPAKNDVVIFLYAGHGFRWKDQTDPYPQLALVTDDYTDIKQTNSFVALSDIDKAIQAKGARLTLVMADCCNSVYGEPSPLPLGSNTLLSRGNSNLSTDRLRSLFMRTKGHMICCAASPGEVSWCNQAGGNFTCNFIEAFRREINLLSEGEEASWKTIIESTVQNTRKYSEQNALNPQNVQRDFSIQRSVSN